MVDPRRGSLLLTIVQAARLSLTMAAFCGLALSAVLIGIAAQPGSARAASVTAGLVKDINPDGSSGPLSLTDVGGTVFFFADDGIHGRELWRTSPISPPDPSDTTLTVRKSLQRLSARGEVSPNHGCKRVIVTLQKKENGTFVKIARKRPALDARSHYRVGFQRPADGRCRIITRFPGDDDHLPSSARSTFYC